MERLYLDLVIEMDHLKSFPDLTREQAERWASLSGTRRALYIEPDGWQYKAVQNTVTGTWHLVPMHYRDERNEREA